MHSNAEKSQETQAVSEGLGMEGGSLGFSDNRPSTVQAKQIQTAANNSPQVTQLKSLQAGANAGPVQLMLAASRSLDSDQSTFLDACLEDGTQLCAGLASSAAGHSEDRFIDEILPGAVGALDPANDNLIFLSINRSPCTSTDHCGNGHPSSGKAGGAAGCAERLIGLVTAGYTAGGTTYPITLNVQFRNLYGAGQDKQANSLAAIQAMTATGRITCDTHQLGGASARFMGSAAAKQQA